MQPVARPIQDRIAGRRSFTSRFFKPYIDLEAVIKTVCGTQAAVEPIGYIYGVS